MDWHLVQGSPTITLLLLYVLLKLEKLLYNLACAWFALEAKVLIKSSKEGR